jgi:hypothetical protein
MICVMMKSILIVSVLCLGLSYSQAQTTKPKAKKPIPVKVVPQTIEGAGMLFKSDVIDYGKIAHKSNGEREFVFTNNGNKALLIKNATSTCGCTVPTFPKDSIQPGEKGAIIVKFDTSRAGPFSKTVTVTSNAVQGSTKILLIKGDVAIPPRKVSEPNKS